MYYLVKQRIPRNIKIFLTISYVSLWTPKIFYYDKVEIFALFNDAIKLIEYSFKYSLFLL